MRCNNCKPKSRSRNACPRFIALMKRRCSLELAPIDKRMEEMEIRRCKKCAIVFQSTTLP